MRRSTNRRHRLATRLMRQMRPVVAILIVYLMTPMATEITENIIHFGTTGHTAHALNDVRHQQKDPEHCCSGPMHICSCCHSTGFMVPIAEALAPVQPSEMRLIWGPDELRADGYLGGVFRPPIA
jgi:hypothetical protein